MHTRTYHDMFMKYLTLVHKSDYGYDVSIPSLPGCHSQGDTEKDALENIQDAILTYLEMEREELNDVHVREVEVSIV